MDEASILKAGRKPLADEIQKVILAFPASGSPADKTGLSKALGHLNRLGLRVPSFLNLDSSSDLENSLVNVLKAYETGLDMKMGLIPEYYQNQELLQRYRDTVATMFQTILGDEDVANRIQPLGPKDVTREWSDVAKGVVDFELQLVEILNFQPETNDPSQYNRPLTVEQLSGLTPSIDWTLLLQETLPASVKYTRPIVVSYVPYLTKIDTLLQNTPASALQHYFSWLLIRNHVENLASIYNEPWVAFQSVVSGVPADAKAERFKTCIATINNNLDHLIGHYFVRETFKGNSRKEAMAIINNLVSTYEKNFNDTAWLDQTTRDRAIKKLKAVALAVGYATHDPDATSSKALDAYYKDYNVVASDYFGNQVNYHTWAATRSYFKLHLPFNREEMNEHVTAASANNAFFYNAVSIPAGFIQDPVFNLENPEYVNYGGIGILSAHEIGVSLVNNLMCILKSH
jgi:endothelin-converting enzyme